MPADPPSLARRGLDLLLVAHPGFEVLRVEWQVDGPWLLVDLGLASENPEAFARYPFAIWKRTGAVHGMPEGPNGPVSDEPLWTPS